MYTPESIVCFLIVSGSLILFISLGWFIEIVNHMWLNKHGIDIPAIVIEVQQYEEWGIYGHYNLFKHIIVLGSDPKTRAARKYRGYIFLSQVPAVREKVYVKVNPKYPWHHYIRI